MGDLGMFHTLMDSDIRKFKNKYKETIISSKAGNNRDKILADGLEEAFSCLLGEERAYSLIGSWLMEVFEEEGLKKCLKVMGSR